MPMHYDNTDLYGSPIFDGDTIQIRMGHNNSSVFEKLARLSRYPWAKTDQTYIVYDARPNGRYRYVVVKYTDDNGVVHEKQILHDHVIKVIDNPCQFIEILPI